MEIQIAYKISVSLVEYDRRVKGGEWEFPSYKDCCGICKRRGCAIKHGFYYRPAFTEDNKSYIPDVPIIRYKCKREIVTFSLLPEHLIPYSRYPIRTVSYVVDNWRKFKGKISKSSLNIFSGEDVAEKLLDIGISHFQKFLRLFESALRKYEIWQKGERCSLEGFIVYCSGNNYCFGEELGIKYYKGNGGYIKGSHFLFGKASQFRVGGG